MEEIILTCACGEHTHPISESKDCEKCQEDWENMENDKEYQALLRESKRDSK